MFKETVDVYFEFLFDLSFFLLPWIECSTNKLYSKINLYVAFSNSGKETKYRFLLETSKDAQKRKNDKI